jgi:hypothetical protein
MCIVADFDELMTKRERSRVDQLVCLVAMFSFGCEFDNERM